MRHGVGGAVRQGKRDDEKQERHSCSLTRKQSDPAPLRRPRPNDGGQRAGGVTAVRVVVVRTGGAVRSGGRVGRFWEETFGCGTSINPTPSLGWWAMVAGGRAVGGGRRAVRCRCDVWHRGAVSRCGTGGEGG